MSTMLAMLLERPGSPLRLAEVRRPNPAAGEVLVEVAACGVCRTDLHVADGDLANPKLPLILGHEIVGRIRRARRRGNRFYPGRTRRHSLARPYLRRLHLLPGRS